MRHLDCWISVCLINWWVKIDGFSSIRALSSMKMIFLKDFGLRPLSSFSDWYHRFTQSCNADSQGTSSLNSLSLKVSTSDLSDSPSSHSQSRDGSVFLPFKNFKLLKLTIMQEIDYKLSLLSIIQYIWHNITTFFIHLRTSKTWIRTLFLFFAKIK